MPSSFFSWLGCCILKGLKLGEDIYPKAKMGLKRSQTTNMDDSNLSSST
jgi:hypothetical protein